MSTVITLPNQLYERLAQKSQQLNRTPEAVVTDLVQQFLSEADDRWQTEFQALIAQVQTRTIAHPAGEIEADITVAAAEARDLSRKPRRRPQRQCRSGSPMQANGVAAWVSSSSLSD